MRLTVFTPSHDTRYLGDAYAGLAAQTNEDWEWIVLLNGRARTWAPPVEDPRVRVEFAERGTKGVGALKREACSRASGEVLVELDHDDVFLPQCLERVARAFAENPEAALVYSDFAQISADGTPHTAQFNEANGWEYSPYESRGVVYERCHALAPTPHNMGYIWFQPNHVRSFSRRAYDAAGGYDSTYAVLDDQELMVRLYEQGSFVHIDDLLYLQRVHGKSTQVDPTTNASIQARTVELYHETIRGLALTWTRRHDLRALRLVPPVFYGPDQEDGFEDVLVDIEAPAIPAEDSSVGVVLGTDLLQKIMYRDILLNEVYRVMPHGGLFLTLTPSTDGRGAFQDPSVVSYYNENSFMYLTQAVLRPTIPGLVGRFQVSHLRTFFPSDTHEALKIPYVEANLIAVKDGPRQGGPLLC